MAAGFVDFAITWRADVFSGAPQSSSAANFGTSGISFRARKAASHDEWQRALTELTCDSSFKRGAVLPSSGYLSGLWPG